MNPGPELDRRALLGATGIAAAGLLLPSATAFAAPASAAPAFAAPAFARAGRPVLTHGVQLGDPRADGAVMWTRADRPARMFVEVSRDPDFRRAKRVRGPLLTPETDGTGEVRLTGLPAGQEVHYRVVSFAVFAQGPWDEVEPFAEFMGCPAHWYPADGIDDPAVGGGEFGWVSFLRQGDRVYLTYETTGRGAEVAMPSLALLDMTARGRLEAWQDSPEGWPEGTTPGWFWKSDEHGAGNGWTGGRPTAQWARPGATPVVAHGGHHH